MRKIGRLQIYSTLIAALFAHLAFSGHIRIFGASPEIMLIPVIFFGLFADSDSGFESGFVAGLLRDMFSTDLFGINACIFGVIGFLAGVLGARLSRESGRTQFLLTACLTAFSLALHYAISSALSKIMGFGFGEYIVRSVLPASVYTGAISIVLFSLLAKIFGIKRSEDYL